MSVTTPLTPREAQVRRAAARRAPAPNKIVARLRAHFQNIVLVLVCASPGYALGLLVGNPEKLALISGIALCTALSLLATAMLLYARAVGTRTYAEAYKLGVRDTRLHDQLRNTPTRTRTILTITVGLSVQILALLGVLALLPG